MLIVERADFTLVTPILQPKSLEHLDVLLQCM